MIMVMERNRGIDLLRLLCAFMVVYVHNSIDSPINPYLLVFCKVSVPVFFLITGFYHQSVIDRNREKNELLKVYKLLVFSFVLYLLFYFLLYFRSGSFIPFLKEKFKGNSPIDILVFNVNPLLHRLWYLNALLYVLLIAYLFHRYRQTKLMYAIVPILLIIGLIIEPYSRLILHKDLAEHYSRNFIFIGIPYFYTGWLLNRHSNRINKDRIGLFLLLSVLMTVLEVYLLSRYDLFNSPAFVLTTFPLTVLLFLFFSEKSIQNGVLIRLCEFGRRNSADIYIFHKIIEIILDKMIPVFSNFIVVFILSLLMSLVYRFILEQIKIKKTG